MQVRILFASLTLVSLAAKTVPYLLQMFTDSDCANEPETQRPWLTGGGVAIQGKPCPGSWARRLGVPPPLCFFVFF